jgi:hypothetical protein
MTASENRFDLVVVGSGPAGQKGAIAAAKLGKRVAMIDRREMIGGMSLHTGTIPSKTLREAVLYLTGYRQRAFYGRDYKLKQETNAHYLVCRTVHHERRAAINELSWSPQRFVVVATAIRSDKSCVQQSSLIKKRTSRNTMDPQMSASKRPKVKANAILPQSLKAGSQNGSNDDVRRNDHVSIPTILTFLIIPILNSYNHTQP